MYNNTLYNKFVMTQDVDNEKRPDFSGRIKFNLLILFQIVLTFLRNLCNFPEKKFQYQHCNLHI